MMLLPSSLIFSLPKGEMLSLRVVLTLEAIRLLLFPSSLLVFPYNKWADWSPIARVQRGPSEGARCASKGDERAAPLLLHRAGCEAGWAGRQQDSLF